MVIRAGVVMVWLAVVLSGGWAAAQAPEVAQPERMTLEELLRLQQVVDQVLQGGGEEAGVPQPQGGEPRPPVAGVGDLFPPPEPESAAAGAARPEPDAVVEGVGVDGFVEPSAPAEGEPGGSPVAEPVAEPDGAPAEPEGGVAAAEPSGDGSESEAAAGQESQDDPLAEHVWNDVPAMAAPAAAAPPVMPPDRGGLRLGRDGHPVVLRPPSPAYLRRIPRGTLGYRAPLVAKQRIGPMVVGGVYVPAHDAWVVLRDGHWGLVGETATVPVPSSLVIHQAAPAGRKSEAAGTGPAARRGFWSRLLGRIGPAPGQGE